MRQIAAQNGSLFGRRCALGGYTLQPLYSTLLG
jgi:hypothetical protein